MVLSASVGCKAIRVWVSHEDTVREVDAAGYTLERVVDVNAAGEILIPARAVDETPIAGLSLPP